MFRSVTLKLASEMPHLGSGQMKQSVIIVQNEELVKSRCIISSLVTSKIKSGSLFYSPLPAGRGARAAFLSFGGVWALIQKRNTTFLVLSVQHSTTRFSFFFFFWAFFRSVFFFFSFKHNAKTIIIIIIDIRRAFFHLNGIERTPHKLK